MSHTMDSPNRSPLLEMSQCEALVYRERISVGIR